MIYLSVINSMIISNIYDPKLYRMIKSEIARNWKYIICSKLGRNKKIQLLLCAVSLKIYCMLYKVAKWINNKRHITGLFSVCWLTVKSLKTLIFRSLYGKKIVRVSIFWAYFPCSTRKRRLMESGCYLCSCRYLIFAGCFSVEWSETREKLETIIYRLYKAYVLPLPRRYGRKAKKDNLTFAKCEKCTEKKIRRALLSSYNVPDVIWDIFKPLCPKDICHLTRKSH